LLSSSALILRIFSGVVEDVGDSSFARRGPVRRPTQLRALAARDFAVARIGWLFVSFMSTFVRFICMRRMSLGLVRWCAVVRRLRRPHALTDRRTAFSLSGLVFLRPPSSGVAGAACSIVSAVLRGVSRSAFEHGFRNGRVVFVSMPLFLGRPASSSTLHRGASAAGCMCRGG
jgi:hypothetical protein